MTAHVMTGDREKRLLASMDDYISNRIGRHGGATPHSAPAQCCHYATVTAVEQ
jgi:hypothetical protein